MATFTFAGDYVGVVNSANDDGSDGVNLQLDAPLDLDGNGNLHYASTYVITIAVAYGDVNADGEFQAAGADGEVTVTSILVNGVELLRSLGKIEFSGIGSNTFEGGASLQDPNRANLAPMRPLDARPRNNGQMIGTETGSW